MSQHGCVTVTQRPSTRNKPARDPAQRTKDRKQQSSGYRSQEGTRSSQQKVAGHCVQTMKCRPTLSGQKPIPLAKITLDIGSPKPRVDQPIESPSASY